MQGENIWEVLTLPYLGQGSEDRGKKHSFKFPLYTFQKRSQYLPRRNVKQILVMCFNLECSFTI